MTRYFANDGGKSGRFMFLALITAAIGTGLSAWLAYMHIAINTDPSYVSVCALGKTMNCETVAASKYSVFLGLPVAVWGGVAFAAATLLAAFDLKRGKSKGTVGVLFVLGCAMSLASLALMWISTFAIKAVCLFCAAVYLVTFALAGLVFFEVKRRGGVIANLKSALETLAGNRFLLVFFGVLAATLAAMGPLGFFPRYWELASWRDGPPMPQGFDAEGRPWLGAPNPVITVHEYLDYDCPHCHVAHRKLRKILAEHAKELRIVRHDHARMACAPNDMAKKLSRCSAARAAHCAAGGGRYWDWNDAVMADPKPPSGTKRDDYELNMAVTLGFEKKTFEECMFAKETVDFAQREYMEARERGVLETPMYRVGEKVLNFKGLDILLDEKL